MLINEITPPAEKARIDSLKRQKDVAAKALKAERAKAKIVKGQKQLRRTIPKIFN
jgi:hypothetical protein